MHSRCESDSDDEWRIDPLQNESPAGAGLLLARDQLLLAARETESSESEAEQRERGGLRQGYAFETKCALDLVRHAGIVSTRRLRLAIVGPDGTLSVKVPVVRRGHRRLRD